MTESAEPLLATTTHGLGLPGCACPVTLLQAMKAVETTLAILAADAGVNF
jgi:hypothetical protein